MDRRQFIQLLASTSLINISNVEAALSLNDVRGGAKSMVGLDVSQMELKIANYYISSFLRNGIPRGEGQTLKPIRDVGANQAIKDIAMPIFHSSTRKNLQWHILLGESRHFKSGSVNAFTPGGGVVFIQTGLIKACNNEAELASVIAHEVGHIEYKHAIRRLMANEILKQYDLTVDLKKLDMAQSHLYQGGEVDFQFLISVSNEVLYKGFTRLWEYEADAFILRAFQYAGYNVNDASKFFYNLMVPSANIGELGRFGTCLFVSHPETLERIKRIDAIASSMSSYGALKNDSIGFRYLKKTFS